MIWMAHCHHGDQGAEDCVALAFILYWICLIHYLPPNYNDKKVCCSVDFIVRLAWVHSEEWIMTEMAKMDSEIAHAEWKHGKISGAVYRTSRHYIAYGSKL